jgi:hypothetical protein
MLTIIRYHIIDFRRSFLYMQWFSCWNIDAIVINKMHFGTQI